MNLHLGNHTVLYHIRQGIFFGYRRLGIGHGHGLDLGRGIAESIFECPGDGMAAFDCIGHDITGRSEYAAYTIIRGSGRYELRRLTAFQRNLGQGFGIRHRGQVIVLIRVVIGGAIIAHIPEAVPICIRLVIIINKNTVVAGIPPLIAVAV